MWFINVLFFTIVTGFSLKSVVGWLQIEVQYLTFVTFFYKGQGHGSVGKSLATGPVSCGTEQHSFEHLFLFQNQLALSLCTLVLKQVRPWRQCKIREKGLALKKKQFYKAYSVFSVVSSRQDPWCGNFVLYPECWAFLNEVTCHSRGIGTPYFVACLLANSETWQ